MSSVGNDDLRGLPLSERERILETLVIECDPVRYIDQVIGAGREFFELVKQTRLEGMVPKRLRSKYSGTLTDDWLKVKCMRTHDFIVGGGFRTTGDPLALCCWVSLSMGVSGMSVRSARLPMVE